MTNFSKPVSVSLKVLKPYNPIGNNVWGTGIIYPNVVLDKIRLRDFELSEFSATINGVYNRKPWDSDRHASRIAYLASVAEPLKPIDIDVGIPSMGCHVAWPILDGNHRLAAAFVRKQETINVLFSGCIETIEQFIAGYFVN